MPVIKLFTSQLKPAVLYIFQLSEAGDGALQTMGFLEAGGTLHGLQDLSSPTRD